MQKYYYNYKIKIINYCLHFRKNFLSFYYYILVSECKMSERRRQTLQIGEPSKPNQNYYQLIKKRRARKSYKISLYNIFL